jgi:hypothetical protein
MLAQRVRIFDLLKLTSARAARNPSSRPKPIGNLLLVSPGMTNAPFVPGFFQAIPC